MGPCACECIRMHTCTKRSIVCYYGPQWPYGPICVLVVFILPLHMLLVLVAHALAFMLLLAFILMLLFLVVQAITNHMAVGHGSSSCCSAPRGLRCAFQMVAAATAASLIAQHFFITSTNICPLFGWYGPQLIH